MGNRHILAWTILMILTAFFPFNGDAEQDPSSFVFDEDGDGIDDLISGEGPFSVIVHHNGDTSGCVGSIIDNGGKVDHVFSIVDSVSAEMGSWTSMEDLASSDTVEVIEAQRYPILMMDTSVPAVKASDSSTYPSGNAENLGFFGDGVTMAVIDSGVDNEHPMLRGSFVAGADFTIPALERDGTRDPDDRSGHGTALASIALGRENNGTVGVAPEAGLIDLKITTALNNDVNPVTDEMLQALEWCLNNSRKSWGNGHTGIDVALIGQAIGPPDGAVALAIDELSRNGISVVQAAGNSGGSYDDQSTTSWPDRSIVVGGLDHKGTVERSDDTYWQSSTSGPRSDDGDGDGIDELKPDVSAPAVDISFAAFSTFSNVQPAQGMSSGSGTSFSASHVAGTIALMIEANDNIAPTEDSSPVARIIHQSAEPRGEASYPSLSSTYNVNYGWGILDSYQAVLAARAYSGVNHRPQITSFTAEPPVTTTGSVVELRVIATDVDEDVLSYELEVDEGEFTGEGPIWEWTAPQEAGNYSFLATVTDTSGASDQLRTNVEVREGSPNSPPVITSFNAERRVLGVGETTSLTVSALDQDDDPLEYRYDTVLGSITGSGAEVTYVAPDDTGTDTVSVRVTDPSGSSDRRELTITITEDSDNSPPSITLVHIEPTVINSSTVDSDVILRAQVSDPDGLADISLVLADLSNLGGSTGESMEDDGTYPDNTSSDGVYSVLVDLPTPPMNGVYTINVTVIDSSDAEAEDSVQLRIDISDSGDVTGGRSSSFDMTLALIVMGIILILVIMVVVFLVARRRKRSAGYPPANIAKVRYRPTVQNQSPIQAGPPAGQGQPRFNIVSQR